MSLSDQFPSSPDSWDSRATLNLESQHLLESTRHDDENDSTSGDKRSKQSSGLEGFGNGYVQERQYYAKAMASAWELGSSIHSNMPHTSNGDIDWSNFFGLTVLWLLLAATISVLLYGLYCFCIWAWYTAPAQMAADEAEKSAKAAARAADAVLRGAAYKAQIKGVETLDFSDLLVEIRGLRAAAEIIARSME